MNFHGHTSKNGMRNLSPEYHTWVGMRTRCNNSNSSHYRHYGGRGISVCAEWESFAQFLSDMGQRPAGTTLDRIDNNKGYYPDNCRWATKSEQMRNKRTNRVLEYKGTKYTLCELAKISGYDKRVITYRLSVGYSIEDAIEKPKRSQNKGK